MTLAAAITTYLNLNFLVAVAAFSLYGVSRLASYFHFSSRSELKFHYTAMKGVFGLSLFILWAPHLLPKREFFQPPMKVWSASSLKTFSQEQYQSGFLTVPAGDSVFTYSAETISRMSLVLALIVLSFAGVRLGKDIHRLSRIRRQSFRVRQVGRVSIFINDSITVPFSYWLPYQNNVVIPLSLVQRSKDYRIAISHEIQHHRQLDTRWIYVMWLLRTLCVFNPCVYLWSRWLSEIQEFACDETLIGRKNVESQQYASCLVEVAKTALSRKYVPDCATGLTFLTERNLLKRRVEKMNSISNPMKRSTRWSLTALIASAMVITALTAQGLVQDRRISLTEAQALATNSKRNSEFPIVVNDLVLKQLNRYVGTPEGRDFMRKALQRMEIYRKLIETKIKNYQVPTELMAVPLVESGYQNLEQGEKQSWGAGLWMFIASTARVFGLRVDDKVDERLNPEILTEAAIRYLKSDQLKFNDWLLALMSYNMGDKRVFEAIQKTGSRDAWTLIRNGYENDKDYLARVMAAILIMRNPETVN